MKKFLSIWMLTFLFIGNLSAQQAFKVQGFPRTDLKGTAEKENAAPDVKLRGSTNFTFDDIKFWVGEGSNRAGFVVEWEDPRISNAMVWGFQWDGDAYGVNIFYEVAKADPRFYYLQYGGTAYGTAISGIGYDANDDGIFTLTNKKTGKVLYPDENGIFNTKDYDFDDYVATDSGDYWQAGWYDGYWSYWVKDNINEPWGYSGLGASSRKLKNGSWDGWNFAENMVNPTGFKDFIAAEPDGITSGTFFLGVDNTTQKSVLSYLSTSGELTYNMYKTANNESLDNNTGLFTVFGNKFYFVAGKTATTTGSITAVGEKKLIKTGKINNVDGCSFVGVSAQKAYVGTGNGIYTVNLDPLSLGSLISGTDNQGETGMMLKTGNHVFAVLKSTGIVVINTETENVEQTIEGDFYSITQSIDGNIWAINNAGLIKINPETFGKENVNIPEHCKISSEEKDLYAGSFFADKKTMTLYWANSGANAITTVYQYKIGNASSLNSPFYSLPNGAQLTGMGLKLSQTTKNLFITAKSKSQHNEIYVIDANTGNLLKTYQPTDEYVTASQILFPDSKARFSGIEGSLTLPVNSSAVTILLNGKVSDDDNLDRNIKYSAESGNPSVVSAVLSDGKLIITPQPNQSGSAEVSLHAESNGAISTKKINVVITRALEGISFEYTEKTIKKGSKDTLNVIFTPENATNKTVTWSRTGSYVSVTDGVVKARSVGESTVKATSEDGSFVAECVYTVVDEPVLGVSVDKPSTTIYVNQKDTVTVTFNPEDASNKAMTWTSGDNSIAKYYTYSSGSRKLIIKGISEGTTVFTGKTKDGGYTVTCDVTVVFKHATSIDIPEDTLKLKAPDYKYLDANFLPEDCSNKQVNWTSTDPTVASVNTSGKVVAVGAGIAKIIAQATDDTDLTDTICVMVDYVPLTALKIEKDTTLAVGKSFYATTTFTPTDASNKTLTWESSDDAIAIVNTSGKITAKSSGKAFIKATSEDGGLKDSCTVTVVDSIPVAGLSFKEKEIWLKASSSQFLDYVFTPAEATVKSFVCKSEDPKIAKFNSSTSSWVRAVALGTVKVSITSQNGVASDTCIVHVIPSVTSLSLNKTNENLFVGDTLRLQATALPAESNQVVTWGSSEQSVASVNDQGVVVALKAGTAQITAVSEDDYSIKATCDITVSEQLSTKIVLSDTTKRIFIGEKFKLTAKVLPENTTNKNLKWASSDYDVVCVSSTGEITGVKSGTATITVRTQDGGTLSSCKVTVSVPTINISFSDIKYWVGEGDKKAAVVIKWNDGKDEDAMTWGYKWNGDKKVIDMLKDIAKEDERLFILLNESNSVTIGGFGFDRNGEKINAVVYNNNKTYPRYPFNGLVTAQNAACDFDNYTVMDEDDHWCAGVSEKGVWDYLVMEDGETFSPALKSVIEKDLVDNSWNAWNYDAGFKDTPLGYDFTAVPKYVKEDIDYTKGIFFVNEEWFGHTNGSVNFLTDKGKWIYRAYTRENPEQAFGCTTQFGTIYGDNFYFISKQAADGGDSQYIPGGRLVVADAKTLKKKAGFDVLGTVGDGRSFLGVDAKTGYIAGAKGILLFDIKNLKLGEVIPGTDGGSSYSGQIGTMLRIGDYVFACKQGKGLLVIDANTHTLKKQIDCPKIGTIVQSKDGSLWASAEVDGLWKINPYTFEVEKKIAIPNAACIPNTWGAWTSGVMAAGNKTNTLYWAKMNGSWGMAFFGSRVYKYDIDKDDVESADFLSKPFYVLTGYDGKEVFYGAALKVNPGTDDLVITTTRSGYSSNYQKNRVHIVDGETGIAKHIYELNDYYWFPAMSVFPDKEAPVVSDKLSDLYLQRDTAIWLGDKVHDADNFNAAIIKSITSVSNKNVMNATIRNDSLIINLSPNINGHSSIAIKFNSNGKITTKTILVTAVIPVTDITLDCKDKTIYTGETLQLYATIKPINASNKNVIWSSDNTAVATVDQNGIVTAVYGGSVIITATTEDGNKTASCVIKVEDKVVTIDPPTLDNDEDGLIITFKKIESATLYELTLYKYVGSTIVLVGTYTLDSNGNPISGLRSFLRSNNSDEIKFVLGDLEAGTNYYVKIAAIKEVNGYNEFLYTTTTNTISTPVANEFIDKDGIQIYYSKNMLHLRNLNGYRCQLVSINGKILESWNINSNDEKRLVNRKSGIYIIVATKEDDRVTKKILIN